MIRVNHFLAGPLLECSAPLLCEDDLTVYSSVRCYFLKIIVKRVDHFLAAWILECSELRERDRSAHRSRQVSKPVFNKFKLNLFHHAFVSRDDTTASFPSNGGSLL